MPVFETQSLPAGVQPCLRNLLPLMPFFVHKTQIQQIGGLDDRYRNCLYQSFN